MVINSPCLQAGIVMFCGGFSLIGVLVYCAEDEKAFASKGIYISRYLWHKKATRVAMPHSCQQGATGEYLPNVEF